MSAIYVQGLHPLKGEIEIQGSKNAVLPMMAAAVLHKGTTTLTHVPRIQDVFCMMGILESMGCICVLKGHTLTIQAENLTDTCIPEDDVKAMRSSIMILGALLGRTKRAVTHYPGGCSIGKRPIDLHLYALRKLGAKIEELEDLISAETSGLIGTEICFPYPSVGATENAVLAAVLAEGTTVIRGAAREPEVEELCLMLTQMGADIAGYGTDVLVITGVGHLKDVVYDVPGDRIVAGTYLSAVMAVGGSCVLRRVTPGHLEAVLKVLEQMGAGLQIFSDGISIRMTERPGPAVVQTSPYPGFPTDLQSMLLVLLSVCQGKGSIRENVFEGRFATAKELQKMGAGIIIEGKEAHVTGHFPLTAAWVTACDLRGGAALAVAGLAAEGETRIEGCRHIMRGYEDICGDLEILGAKIRREL